MAGWKFRAKKLFPLFFLVIFLLQGLFPQSFNLLNVTPVSADEAEEEDGFRQMPNFRWRNLSTTSGNVDERLIEDVYQVSTINNPSGSSTFRKSRALNSRDFYFESRFALDVGGSTVEVFQDELGDAVDWEEGDYDGYQGWEGASYSLSPTGFLSVWRNVPDSVWGIRKGNMFGMNCYTSSYRYLEFRIKGTGASQVDFWLQIGTNRLYLINGDIPTEFETYLIDLWTYPVWVQMGELGDHFFYTSTTSSGSFLLDYVRYYGIMDYASFYQGEIEDAWDFDEFADTQEYWDDVYGNVSDFNDGSKEVWNPYYEETFPENLIAWYKIDGTGSTVTDSGPNGLDGTLEWTTTRTDSFNEAMGKCVLLDASPEWISVPDNDLFSFDGDAGGVDDPFSIDVWVKATGASGRRIIAGKYDLDAGGQLEYNLLQEGTEYRLRLVKFDDPNTAIYADTNSSGVQTGVWRHITATYNGNGSGSGIKIYINGSDWTDHYGMDGTYTGMTNKASTFKIGRYQGGYQFYGTIDNVRVWNKTLSQEEAQLFYEQAPTHFFPENIVYVTNHNGWLNVTRTIKYNTSLTDLFSPDLLLRNPLNDSFVDVTGNGHNIVNSGSSFSSDVKGANWEKSIMVQDKDFYFTKILAWYPMNEGSGSTVTDVINGYNGVTGSTHWITSPINGSGVETLDFPSPNSITISNDDPFTFTDEFSIEIWFNHTAGSQGSIVCKDGPFDGEFDLWTTTGRTLTFEIRDTDYDYIGRRTNAGAISLNKWSHIVVTYDNSSSSSGIKIYVNGTQVDTTDYNSGVFNGIVDTTNDVSIGGDFQEGHGFVIGEVDECRFWNIELIQSKIQDLYNDPLTPWESDTDQGFYYNDHSDLNFCLPLGVDLPFTWEFWLKANDSYNDPAILMRKAEEYELTYLASTNELEMKLWVLGIETNFIACKVGGISEGVWNHLIISYNANETKEGLIWYLNGVVAPIQSRSSFGVYVGMHAEGFDVWWGSDSGDWGGEYWIDEIRLFNRFINASEASDLFSFSPYMPIYITEDIQRIIPINSDPLNPALDRDVYEVLEFELYNVRGKIENITVYNGTMTKMFEYPHNISQGETKRLFLNGLSEWTGTASTSDFLIFQVSYYNESVSYQGQFHLNYTYLRDFADSFDDWGNYDSMWIYNDTVNFFANATNDLELLTLRNIPSEYFENFRIRIKGETDLKYQLKAYDGSSWVNMTSMVDFTTSWGVYEQSLRLVSDWKDVSNQRKLGLQFYNSSGLPITDFEEVAIDYIQLIGHFDEEEGFKFALYNEDDQEGMFWKFTRIGAGIDETYLVTVNMLDSTGEVLKFNQTFGYNRYVDGWLRLDVQWHLDKKQVKMTFEYENGTDIVKTRSITYFYRYIPMEMRLLLLEEGFPQLCMDNSISGFSKSIVWIDYIDADWQTIEWIEDPTGTDWKEDDGIITPWYSSGYPYQDNYNLFTGINPYGMSQFLDEADGIGHYFWLNIDRFDGVKYDLRINHEGFTDSDYQDYIRFYSDIYQVNHDGSTDPIIQSEYWMYKEVGNFWTHVVYHNEGQYGSRVSHHLDLAVTSRYMDVSYSFFRESEDKLILQDTFDNGETTAQNDLTFRSSGYTQEFIIFFYYYLNNTNGGWANDEVKIEIRGFDVQRKDILGGIVAAILSPILFVLGVILTPVILILQALMIALGRMFGTLLAGLTSALTPILTGIITTLGVFLDPILSFVGEILELINEFAPLLLEIFLAAIEEYVAFLQEFWGLVIDAIILPFLFDLFDSLGLLPLLEFVLVFIQDFMLIIGDVIALVTAFFGYLFASALYWFDVGRLGALTMWIIFFVVVYVFSPLLDLWKTDFDKLELEQITDAFGVMFERIFGLVVFAFNFTTYLFNFIFNVLKTIGNFIPFT